MVDSEITENIVIANTTSNIINEQFTSSKKRKTDNQTYLQNTSSSSPSGASYISSLNALSNIPYFNYPSTMALFNNSTYISRPKSSSPLVNHKRSRGSQDTIDDDELNQQKYPPILVQMSNGHFGYDHVDIPSFLNSDHDHLPHHVPNHHTLEHDNHKLAQYPRGTRKEGDTRRKRGNCRQCPNTISGKRNARQTSYFCVQCGISLHPDCFHTYHQNLANIKISSSAVHTAEMNLRNQNADNILVRSSTSANSSRKSSVKTGKNSVEQEK